jgi:hypothetical protein
MVPVIQTTKHRIPLRDSSLPHQIRLRMLTGNKGIAVGCNCLGRGKYFVAVNSITAEEAKKIYKNHLMMLVAEMVK